MTGMIIGGAVVFALFFMMCFAGTGGDKRNMGSYYSYPDAVQDKIKEDETLRAMIPKKKSQASVYISNIVMFTVVFLILGLILNIRKFVPVFCYFLILGEGLNIFDLIVIDMCWWRNTGRTKFSSIPDKALYMDMKKHVASFVRGIPVFIAAALISALILMAIPAFW